MKVLFLFNIFIFLISCSTAPTYEHPAGMPSASLRVDASIIKSNGVFVSDDVALIKMLDMKNESQIGYFRLKPENDVEILEIPIFEDMTLMAWLVFSGFGENSFCKVESIFSPREGISYDLILGFSEDDGKFCTYELLGPNGEEIGKSEGELKRTNLILH